MIVGLGIDITEIERIEVAQAKRASFAKKVLTPQEYEIFLGQSPKRQGQYLAGRFSVKELTPKHWVPVSVVKFLFKIWKLKMMIWGAPFLPSIPEQVNIKLGFLLVTPIVW